jgi:hypothetical protein
MLIDVRKCPSGKSKLQAIFDDGTRVCFGSPTSTTFAEGASLEKRNAYLKRHSVNENWNVRSKGALSRWVLWEKRSIKDGIKSYNKNVREK